MPKAVVDNTMMDLVKKAFVGDVPEGYEPIHVGKEIKSFLPGFLENKDLSPLAPYLF